MSKTNPTARNSSGNESKTVFYMPPRSSETSGPSSPKVTPEHIAEWLMSLPLASPVSPSLAQEKASLDKTTETSGRRLGIAFAKFDPESSFWKTFPALLTADISDECSGIWPFWGLMHGGVSFRQPTPELLTLGSVSGFWRTPDTGMGGTSGLLKKGITHRPNGQPVQVRLVDQVQNPQMWPTPNQSMNAGFTVDEEKRKAKTSGGYRRGHEGNELLRQALARGGIKTPQKWTTPTARDSQSYAKCKRGEGSKAKGNEKTVPLAVQAGRPGGQLNPDWVEWLMGWPTGWTALEPLGMDKFRQWLFSHGIF